jgi:hypothetical protein
MFKSTTCITILRAHDERSTLRHVRRAGRVRVRWSDRAVQCDGGSCVAKMASRLIALITVALAAVMGLAVSRGKGVSFITDMLLETGKSTARLHKCTTPILVIKLHSCTCKRTLAHHPQLASRFRIQQPGSASKKFLPAHCPCALPHWRCCTRRIRRTCTTCSMPCVHRVASTRSRCCSALRGSSLDKSRAQVRCLFARSEITQQWASLTPLLPANGGLLRSLVQYFALHGVEVLYFGCPPGVAPNE